MTVLAPGLVFARRYELQDLVSERLGAKIWRAHDTVLTRNVRLELLDADDTRAQRFLEAARQSTRAMDPRFLRVLDLLQDENGFHGVVREWARAFPLDQIIGESALPNRRAAVVVAEVAEALAHAHEQGLYHRQLRPHHVLLKESGAVRVTGLCVAAALSPSARPDDPVDPAVAEQADVEALGKLLYACLVSRWPGAPTGALKSAPAVQGRLLRPRQVRAGVSRDVDTVVDRILGDPPQQHRAALTTAADVAGTLRLAGNDEEVDDDQSSLVQSSPDLLRSDPVVEPSGPPPGLEPPRRRPKAFEPAPPTRMQRGRRRAGRPTRGDRGLIALGVVGVLGLVLVIGSLVARSLTTDSPRAEESAQAPERAEQALDVRRAFDLDPFSSDGAENTADVPNVLDGDLDTVWRTSTYYRNPALGGLKPGVGLVLDLGQARDVDSVRVRLEEPGVDLRIYTARPGVDRPTSTEGLTQRGQIRDAGQDASISLATPTLTRYVVVWLTRLPSVGDDEYRGGIAGIEVRGTP